MTDVDHVLAPRSSSDTDGEVQRVLGKLESSGHGNEILSLIANSPVGFRPFVQMSNALLTRSALPPQVREVAILTMAAANDVSYEWHEHVAWGERVGLTKDQIDAIRDGVASDGLFSADQLLAMRIARGAVTGGQPSDADWVAMCEAWGKETALDLVFVLAWWGGFVPVVIRFLGLS